MPSLHETLMHTAKAFRLTGERFVPQGHSQISRTGEPLRSDSFISCHAVLITNPSSGMSALSHMTESGVPAEMKRHRRQLDLLGEGEKQAVLIVGKYSNQPEESLQLLKSLGLESVRQLQVPTENSRWRIIYYPTYATASVLWGEKNSRTFAVFPK